MLHRGQGMVPYEQKTQQSPGFGRSTAPHAGQSQKNWQLSVGMAASVTAPHPGHVMVETSAISAMRSKWGKKA